MEELKTTVVDYGEGIFAIDQQMVRAFLIVGENKALLLDTGAIKIDMVSTIKEITSLPVEVILTHGDIDHIGNLQDFETARIHKDDIEDVLSHEDCKNVKLLPIDEGDLIDIGKRILKVIFTPGHTAGSVCFLDEENKILFAGDTVSYGPVFMFGERRNMENYLSSLIRLKKMKDAGEFTTVYCCHNTCPISGDTIEDLIACVQGIMDNTIPREIAKLPLPTQDRVNICKYGKCGILV